MRMGATNPSSNNNNPQKGARAHKPDPTLITGRSGRQLGPQTHVAVVDVEDVDSGRRLDFLHSGPVPGGDKREGDGGREETEDKEMSQ